MARTRPLAALRLPALLLPVVILGMACGTDPVSSDIKAREVLEAGWLAYRMGDFTTADLEFRKAQKYLVVQPEAALGNGWALLRLRQVFRARSLFRESANFVDLAADAQAGLALASWGTGELSEAIDASELVLELDTSYVFERDSLVDWRDMRLLAAQAHILISPADIGHLRAADIHIRALDSGPQIDPQDPTTWFDGFGTYRSAAEAVIRRMERIVARGL